MEGMLNLRAFTPLRSTPNLLLFTGALVGRCDVMNRDFIKALSEKCISYQLMKLANHSKIHA